MNKEELEKEAEVFVSEKADKGNFDLEQFGKAYFSESSMKQALVKFAEPREKQIAELKKQQFSLRNERNTFLVQNEQYEKDLIGFNVNLSKAKDIIKNLIGILEFVDGEQTRELKTVKEAEQFLKEAVKL